MMASVVARWGLLRPILIQEGTILFRESVRCFLIGTVFMAGVWGLTIGLPRLAEVVTAYEREALLGLQRGPLPSRDRVHQIYYCQGTMCGAASSVPGPSGVRP